MEKLEIPGDVIDSDWKDDIDYVAFEEEGTYISPNEVQKTTIERIKNSPIKLAIRGMVDWNKVEENMEAQ